MFEQRGDAEDARLGKAFVKACGGANQWNRKLPFEIVFANKQQNMPRLQIADLAAYPIACKIINPKAPNPSFDAIRPLFENRRPEKYWDGVKVWR